MNNASAPAIADGVSHVVDVPEFLASGSATRLQSRQEQGRRYCEQLERGNILLFPATPFEFPEADREFLLAQRQSEASYHKNIAYRPDEDRLTGYGKGSREDEARMHSVLKDYSDRAARFLSETLLPYAEGFRRDFASFRPLEEQSRDLRVRARNDLLHTDAFPTRPVNGNRILRLFTNINPSAPRVWITSETFEPLAKRYAREAGLERIASSQKGGLAAALKRIGRRLGIPSMKRSAYDAFMLGFHHFLKENQKFQETCPKNRWEFLPGSTWMVFTDMVSHAVLSGQFAIEQTFIVSRGSLVLSQKSPAGVLESLAGHPLTDD